MYTLSKQKNKVRRKRIEYSIFETIARIYYKLRTELFPNNDMCFGKYYYNKTW